MSGIVLCPNPQRDVGFKLTSRVYRELTAIGETPEVCPLFEKYGEAEGLNFARARELHDVLPGARMIIAFGGDGTLLYIARAAADFDVPILGVNLGTKGFIAEVERDDIESIMKAVSDAFETEQRMMLDVTVTRDGEEIYRNRALNDVVIGGIAQVISLSVFADEHRALHFSGDGIVIATPTGSTAYSMAAGGPIVEPTAENIILTPICAHELSARAFVLSSDRTIMAELRSGTDRRAYVSADGTGIIDLRCGDLIKVAKSEKKAGFIKASNDSFYEKVYRKLGEHR